MTKLNYEKIMDIQENATKKLLNYIGQYIKNEHEIDGIEFHYPDFDKNRTAVAFNVWVSLDYRTKDGKYFIEHFLEENTQHLTSLEKEILKERNKSHISLFEVIEIVDDYMYVEDLLRRKVHKVLEPELTMLINTSDLIFGRIAKVIDFKKFIGDVNFLPNFAKDTFIEKILFDYNKVRLKKPNLTIEKYLRVYSSNVYRIYTECIYDLLDMDDAVSNRIAFELDSYKMYLDNKLPPKKINKYINYLINVYEFFLFDDDYTLHDLDKVDIEPLLIDGINEGFILNQTQLNLYIDSLKSYLNFLRRQNNKYNKAFEDILRISRKRFTYLNINEQKNIPRIKNLELVSVLEDELNNDAYNFLIDYKKFLAYIQINDVGVTKTRKHIKRKHLIEINNLLKNKKDLSGLKAPNQVHIPILQLFYEFSLYHDVLALGKNIISPSNNFSHYLNLSEESRLALFVEFLWYQMETDSYSDATIYFFRAMGILKLDKDLSLELSPTPLGHKILTSLKSYDEAPKDPGKITYLSDYIRSE